MFLHPLLSDLPGDEKTSLIQASKPVFVKKGEPVVQAGEVLEHMLLVATGVLRVETMGTDNVMSTTGFLGPHDVYLETIHGPALPAKSSVLAALNSSIHRVPLALLRTYLLKYPSFGLRLLQMALDDQQKLRKQLRRITAASPEAVVGRTLYELSAVAGAGPNTVDKRITQSAIAAYAGLSRERVNRTMRELETKGLIKRGNEGIVVDTSFSSTDFGSFEATPPPAPAPQNPVVLPVFRLDEDELG